MRSRLQGDRSPTIHSKLKGDRIPNPAITAIASVKSRPQGDHRLPNAAKSDHSPTIHPKLKADRWLKQNSTIYRRQSG